METKAQQLDSKVRQLAKQLLMTEAEILSNLMEMSRLRMFDELNYSGVFDYCLSALKFSREQSYYFRKVAEVSVQVPELKAAVVQGDLSISEAHRIAPILNPANQAEWIEKAKTMKQTELEMAVAEVNPKAHIVERIKPVAKDQLELRVTIDKETEKNLKRLKDLLSQKLRRPVTLADVVAWAAKETLVKHAPEKKAERSLKRKAATPKPAQFQQIVSSGNRRTPIPASERHQVVQSQGARCSFVSADNRRCEQQRWLDLHHVVPVSHGGGNQSTNLAFLCHRHHRAHHRANYQTSPTPYLGDFS